MVTEGGNHSLSRSLRLANQPPSFPSAAMCSWVTAIAAAVAAYNLCAPAHWVRAALPPTAHTLLGMSHSAFTGSTRKVAMMQCHADALDV